MITTLKINNEFLALKLFFSKFSHLVLGRWYLNFKSFENLTIVCIIIIIIRMNSKILVFYFSWFFSSLFSVFLEEVAIIRSWLGRYCWRLKVLVVECRMVKVPMFVEIRLLKVNVSLLLSFVILTQWLNIRMMINFDWLSYLWLVLPTTHTTMNANHVASFQWRVTPQTWYE